MTSTDQVRANSKYPNSDYNSAPDASFWDGLGGATTNNLIQMGCDTIATATVQYKCWTEDYPLGTDWEGPVVGVGDTVYASIYYEGNKTTYYFIENVTTGEAQDWVNASPDVDQSTADFINEVLGPYLPNFGVVAVMNNTFSLANGVTEQLSSTESTKYVMECSGTTNSSPSAVDSTGFFTQTFYHSTPRCS